MFCCTFCMFLSLRGGQFLLWQCTWNEYCEEGKDMGILYFNITKNMDMMKYVDLSCKTHPIANCYMFDVVRTKNDA